MAALRGTRDYIYRKYTIHRHGLLGLVCLLLLCLPGLAEIATSEEVKALRSQTHWRSTRFYTAVALLGLPYYMYAYIWNFPVHWNLIFKGHGVEALSFLCFPVSKIVQAATFLWWSTFDANVAPQELLAEVQHMSSARMLLCLSLCIAGQTLNAGVYRAIGHDGVYYGCKLGRKIPWTTTFPYNLGISHPQYVGAVLTLWALAASISSNVALVESGMVYLLLIWTSMYVLVALMEEGYLGKLSIHGR